jgi:hypothetical protein
MGTLRGAVVFLVLISSTGFAVRSAHANEPSPGSLAKLYADAEKLAEDPATLEQSAARLQELVAVHRENTTLYDRAFSQLLKHYVQLGQGEQAARLVQDELTYKVAEIEAVQQAHVIEQARRRFPTEFAKLREEDRAKSREVSAAVPDTDDADLTKQILQRGDKEVRVKALARIREQLAAGAGAQSQLSGLQSLYKSLSAKFDHAAFRPAVLPLLLSNDHDVRLMAIVVLPGISEDKADIKAILRSVEDGSPRVRASVATALISIGKGEVVGQVAPALVKLLRDTNQDVVHQSIRSMWGQYRTPELNAVLIELANTPQHHHVAIYHGLSPQPEKNAVMCERLVEELADPDWNNSGRAAWGLTFGVMPEARALVEEGLLAAIAEETNAYTRSEEFAALKNVASEKSRAYLTKLAATNEETDDVRKQANEILAVLDAHR